MNDTSIPSTSGCHCIDETEPEKNIVDILFGDFPDRFIKSASAYVTVCEMKQALGKNLLSRAIDDLILIAVGAVKHDHSGNLTYRKVFSDIEREYQADAIECERFISNTEKYIRGLIESTSDEMEEIEDWKHHLSILKANYICLENYIKAAQKLIKDQDSPGESLYEEQFKCPLSDRVTIKAFPPQTEIPE